jgi:hypothetical protein
VLRRKAADYPAGDGEAYNQLQSVDSDSEAALPLVEEHCIAVLDSFQVVEGEDRCCILDIAVEEEVRYRSYFQISTLSSTMRYGAMMRNGARLTHIAEGEEHCSSLAEVEEDHHIELADDIHHHLLHLDDGRPRGKNSTTFFQ